MVYWPFCLFLHSRIGSPLVTNFNFTHAKTETGNSKDLGHHDNQDHTIIFCVTNGMTPQRHLIPKRPCKASPSHSTPRCPLSHPLKHFLGCWTWRTLCPLTSPRTWAALAHGPDLLSKPCSHHISSISRCAGLFHSFMYSVNIYGTINCELCALLSHRGLCIG